MQRRKRAVQYVIHALVAGLGTGLVAACALDGGNVGRLLDHADHAVVARGTDAVGAGVDIGDVVADRAEAQVGLQAAHRLGQGRRILVGGAQNVEGEALRALGSHARQFLQLFNEPGHRLGIAAHDARLLKTVNSGQ